MPDSGLPKEVWQTIVLLAAAFAVFSALTAFNFHSYNRTLLRKLVLAQPHTGASANPFRHAWAAEGATDAVQHEGLWSVNLTDIHRRPSKYAIGVLMVAEDLVTFRWMADDRVQDTTIFLVQDRDDFNSIREVNSGMYSLSVSSNDSRKAGFHGASPLTGPEPQAWDKALFFFCTLAPKYDALWLVEEDVYIPSVEALVGMLHLPEIGDLVVQGHISHAENPDWDHWSHADLQFPEPRYRSMVCAVGMSKGLVAVLNGYVRGFKRLGFVESFFSSIAAHKNLTVLNPSTLKTVEFRHEWSCDDMRNSNMNWFHPIKYQHSFNKKCDFRL